MSYLRHISTRRLLALVVGCALAVGVGAAAIALAAGGAGTTPPPKPLADAIHDALAAPRPAGVSARIDFTNHLVDAASLQGADPLLTGAKGRLWAPRATGCASSCRARTPAARATCRCSSTATGCR